VPSFKGVLLKITKITICVTIPTLKQHNGTQRKRGRNVLSSVTPTTLVIRRNLSEASAFKAPWMVAIVGHDGGGLVGENGHPISTKEYRSGSLK